MHGEYVVLWVFSFECGALTRCNTVDLVLNAPEDEQSMYMYVYIHVHYV